MAGSDRGPRSAVKLSDVAAAAGVAPMTVSRVINTPDRVSPTTAARVRAAIEKLGYVPNLVAGGLSSRRSRMVAAIVPTIAHPMFVEMVQHFTDTMRGAGYQVMLSLSGYNDFAGLDLVRGLLARRPDAMLVTGAEHPPPMRQMLAEAGIPVVEIWDVAPEPVDMLVGLDHVQAGAAVAKLFFEKGISHFAAFAAADTRAQARRRGFTDTVRQRGASVLAEPVLPAPSTITAGRQAMAALAPMLMGRTGLFCSSDMLAFGAITEARVRGIAVPAQLSVCGFGNFELGAANEPPFSTVSVEGAEIGRTAASFLLRRLGGAPPGETDRVLVPFRILERAST
ncbi:MAG TPA: LacI family DNA-binding transcriptional regulator [Acetobacteraceae bacterium]|nr:LacI family DNA-binding transcriptional regulator [Acetobacteraceae bacterium]